MGEAIVFTSGKGGVGKTTTIANIGAGLSQLDKKVVMLDADMGLRNLDVVMGMEDRITYNLFDVLENHCRLNQALIRDWKYPNLYMIPASLKYRDVTEYEDRLLTLIRELKKEFDYCLIDCPAGIDDGFHFAISAADRAMVITTPHVSAVRDAGRVLYLLESSHIKTIDLLINQMNRRMIRRHNMLSQKDIEDVLDMNSFGIIPVDEHIVIGQNKGMLVMDKKTVAQKAFREICNHIINQDVISLSIPETKTQIRKSHSIFHRKECDYAG